MWQAVALRAAMPRPNLKILIWISVWILTRALIVARVGFWVPEGTNYEDAALYGVWVSIMEGGELPSDPTWQYPPGAAFLMLIPRIAGTYEITFIVLMLLFDLVGFWLMTKFAKEEGRDVGVWIWLLGMPLLAAMPVLRFDLVPTVAALSGLLVIHRRPTLFGAIAGIGASIKVWPIFLLFGEWDRRRLLRSVAAAAAAGVAVVVASEIVFGDSLAFLTHQGGRGLQVESVGALPWKVREVVTGEGQLLMARFGSNEIASPAGDAVAKALDFAALAVFALAGVWWWLRDRGIRRGRSELTDIAVSRDFVFTVSLLFVVVSRVLSPQYMIWMVGLCAVVLASRRTRLARAGWLSVVAIVITAGVSQPVAISLVTRNLVLLYAAIDAAVVLTLFLLRSVPAEASERSQGVESANLSRLPDHVA